MSKINIDRILEIINKDSRIVHSIVEHKSIDAALEEAIPIGTTSQTYIFDANMSEANSASIDRWKDQAIFADGQKIISCDKMISLLKNSCKGEALFAEVTIFYKTNNYSLKNKVVFIYYKLSIKERVMMDSHFNKLNVDNVVGDIL